MLTTTPWGCLEIVRGVCSPSADERRSKAGSISDRDAMGQHVTGDEASPLATVLGWAVVVETGIPSVREPLLDALDTLAVLDLVPTAVLELVASSVPPETVHVSEVEAYDALVAKLAVHRTEALELPTSAGLLSPSRSLALVRGISSTSSQQRRSSADTAKEMCLRGVFGDPEASTVAAVLSWAVLVSADDPVVSAKSLISSDAYWPPVPSEERSPEALAVRPALFACLGAMAQADLVPVAVLEHVTTGLQRERLSEVETHHYDDLQTALRSQGHKAIQRRHLEHFREACWALTSTLRTACVEESTALLLARRAERATVLIRTGWSARELIELVTDLPARPGPSQEMKEERLSACQRQADASHSRLQEVALQLEATAQL